MNPELIFRKEAKLIITKILLDQGVQPEKIPGLAKELIKFVCANDQQSEPPGEQEVVVRGFFPDTPTLGNMERKHRMDRLKKILIDSGSYVRPVPLDESCTEWGYFIVAVDDPYELRARLERQEQDHG